MISASVISTNMIYTNAISTNAGYVNTFFFHFYSHQIITAVEMNPQWRYYKKEANPEMKSVQDKLQILQDHCQGVEILHSIGQVLRGLLKLCQSLSVR
jgi:hypothetical protein